MRSGLVWDGDGTARNSMQFGLRGAFHHACDGTTGQDEGREGGRGLGDLPGRAAPNSTVGQKGTRCAAPGVGFM